MAPLKLPEAIRKLKHFIGSSEMLPTEDDIDALVSRRGQGAMLLDHYSPQDVVEVFERYGVTPKLRERGFERFAVALETADPERQTVRLTAERGMRSMLLGECILRDDDFHTDQEFAGPLQGRHLHMLIIQWVRLQDPTRSFTPERPALPGQDHPGCGVGREVMDMFLGLAARLDFSGIMVCPEFAHNAVMYAGQFRFFDPETQGRFEALLRCLDGISLAEFAWGVELGCVVDETSGAPLRWLHEEMIRATDEVVQGYLDSPAYLEAVEGARGAHRFAFDRDRYNELDPLRADGTAMITP
ncbi:MAG: hypothetical protein JRG91_15340 [Deltaproteobacteria bacterium]|nr:hypothetical protein [Deltaproteobacteria bacterium]